MLSKRASFNSPLFSRALQTPEPNPAPVSVSQPIQKRTGKLRMDEEVLFIPSIKRDVVKSAHVFLREIKSDNPFQISICINDYGAGGRLGYYDLSYKNEETAKTQFKEIIDKIKDAREIIEYNLLSSVEVEKMCRKAIDEVLHKSAIFDSSYHGKYKGQENQ